METEGDKGNWMFVRKHGKFLIDYAIMNVEATKEIRTIEVQEGVESSHMTIITIAKI